MELAEQGFQGQESFVPSFQSSPAAQAAQTYAPALAPVVPFPQPAAAPPSAPIPVPEPQASSYPPPVMASVRLTPVDRGYADAPITKEFGSDPYREPIE
jgi:hypothetical protein